MYLFYFEIGLCSIHIFILSSLEFGVEFSFEFFFACKIIETRKKSKNEHLRRKYDTILI